MITIDIAIVAFDDFTDLDVFFPWDLLNRVRLVGGRSDWNVKIIGNKEYHISMAGLKIPTHGTLEELGAMDAVVFSSGIGVQKVLKDETYLSRIKLNPERQLIGSMCSGALILGALGLLTGKRATTYPTAARQLKGYGVNVVNASFVNEGNISTAAGCLAAEELSSWLIRNLAGEKILKRVIESVAAL